MAKWRQRPIPLKLPWGSIPYDLHSMDVPTLKTTPMLSKNIYHLPIFKSVCEIYKISENMFQISKL